MPSYGLIYFRPEGIVDIKSVRLFEEGGVVSDFIHPLQEMVDSISSSREI
jgi:hypothetical protein